MITLAPRWMKRSAAGRMAEALSGTFSTYWIFMPMAFSILTRASSKAWVQPPSVLTSKYSIAICGGFFRVNPWADAAAGSSASVDAAHSARTSFLCMVVSSSHHEIYAEHVLLGIEQNG